MKDKIDLIEIALQKAEENGIYNEMKLEVYFNLYIVLLYTNLEFSSEEIEDEMTLYDTLESQGIFLSVIGGIPDEEYDNLLSWLKIVKTEKTKRNLSIIALLESLIQDLPKNAEAAAAIVESFEPEKYKEVISFAEAANAGRPIPKM